ncbi:hypothetical protein ACJMK2_012407 [Sinanodonta woodiana]|uniref:C2H2-type domain-containing protein n=1 Tax=Sinanodonta woodiana TaxID=1069815 RepID=A0ABD3VB58_SINWO
MNSTFVTHPSIRIKGTENNYNPVQCFDSVCPNKTPHMHCPFCVNTDCYTDPVILKAHYRVKHVDKGIEFAGLKILRCCDHCDIVGIIKGEKKFKGAHWHCYKCRNGFNRRDEAIKHYKTHFRNPQTTFQIQITQEVNQPYNPGLEHQSTSSTPTNSEELSIHPVLTEAVTCMSTALDQTFHQTSHHVSMTNGKLDDDLHVPVAANETVDISDTQTIMIIQEDSNGEQITSALTSQIMCNRDEDQDEGGGGDDSDGLEGDSQEGDRKFDELAQRCQQLEREKKEMEEKYMAEIHELNEKIQQQNFEIANYERREQVLLHQLSIPMSQSIQDVLTQMEIQHRNLLRQQLFQVKREYAASQGSLLSVSVADTCTTSNSEMNFTVNNSNHNHTGIHTSNLGVTTISEQDAKTGSEQMDILFGKIEHIEIVQEKDPPAGSTLLSVKIVDADFSQEDDDPGTDVINPNCDSIKEAVLTHLPEQESTHNIKSEDPTLVIEVQDTPPTKRRKQS